MREFPDLKLDPIAKEQHDARMSRLAAENQLLEEAVREAVGAGPDESPWIRNEDNLRRDAASSGRTADYYADLKIKYERAARYPWLRVEPDTPPPPGQ